jgi:hypothetical protein
MYMKRGVTHGINYFNTHLHHINISASAIKVQRGWAGRKRTKVDYS